MLVALLLGQLTFDPPKLDYWGAPLGGQREVVLGLRPQTTTTMGYITTVETPTIVGKSEIVGPTMTDYQSGYMRWSVKNSTLNGAPCTELVTDAYSVQRARRKSDMRLTNFEVRRYYVSPAGKLLRQVTIRKMDKRVLSGVADFGTESISVTYGEGARERTMEIFPAHGTEAFDRQFQPMVADGQVVLKEKTYDVFDPATAGVSTVTARVDNRFRGTYMGTKFEGQTVLISDGLAQQRAYVSKEGDLIRVDMPHNYRLVIDWLPDSKMQERLNEPLPKIGG